jgi:hypothetical protein
MKTHRIRPTRTHTALLALALGVFGQACSSNSDESDEGELPGDLPAVYDPSKPYEVDIDAADLSSNITNNLFPAPVGAKWVYEATLEQGTERTEVTVGSETKQVWGANARVVHDTVSLNGQMTEDTFDWYAQDDNGHVWYLGEDTKEYANGQVSCTSCGAWEAGVSGALPGVVMPAKPVVGHVYRQEYLKGEAEDYAEIVALDQTITVPAGTFTGCVKTRDRSAIEASADETKIYCPGIGLVLEEEGDERVELIEYSGL